MTSLNNTAKGQRFLITGGAGFIGRRTAAMLTDAGAAVCITDNLSVGMPMPTDPRIETHIADIADDARMMAIAAGFKPDTIVHLAAVHHIPTCERRRAYSLNINVTGTEIMLDVAEKTGTRRFVLASSGAVYDWVDGALHERETPLMACDNYALAKLTNERQVAFWADRTGGETRIARIFNTIGHDDPNAHLIPDILNQLNSAKGRATIELGNTKPRRDYIHADDTAAGIAAIAADPRKGVPTDILNVCSGADASVEELVRLIGSKMGVEIDIKESEARKRRVDRMSQLGDPARTAGAIGWRASIPLGDAVADIVANFAFKPI